MGNHFPYYKSSFGCLIVKFGPVERVGGGFVETKVPQNINKFDGTLWGGYKEAIVYQLSIVWHVYVCVCGHLTVQQGPVNGRPPGTYHSLSIHNTRVIQYIVSTYPGMVKLMVMKCETNSEGVYIIGSREILAGNVS